MWVVAILLYPKVRDNPIIIINLGYVAYKFVTAGQMSVQIEKHVPQTEKIMILPIWPRVVK